MLTVVECTRQSYPCLYYVLGGTLSSNNINYIVCLNCVTENIETLRKDSLKFRYFVDDKGRKYDIKLNKIKNK